ncbi:olfactory receptor 14C36-like [Rhea pennata]|uniref:olfactory receptor 14C36-like n=1 Tax=Rhea pennata TaxID=8795 RepID=UPI002E262565
MSNSSSLNEFLLLAFADMRELQLLHFSFFLSIYLAALLGNGLLIIAIASDHRLHTPMYFFLLNLSLLDLGSISTTVPTSMANSLWDTRAISYTGCAAQMFLLVFFLGGECSLLTVMAYDRYIAICGPLHYSTLMGSRTCVKMAAAAWASGFINALLQTANTFSLPLCQGNNVDQFFCEIPQILKLSRSDSYLREAGLLLISAAWAQANELIDDVLGNEGCIQFSLARSRFMASVQTARSLLPEYRIDQEQEQHQQSNCEATSA